MKNTTSLTPRTLAQAETVKENILANHIIRIKRRGTLDRMIEVVKFPEVAVPRFDSYRTKTVYFNNQYVKIRNYLVSSGFLIQDKVGKMYVYTVNKS